MRSIWRFLREHHETQALACVAPGHLPYVRAARGEQRADARGTVFFSVLAVPSHIFRSVSVL